jgi:hypothetical protein
MHIWNTPIGRWRGLLVATIMLGILLFAVTATQATGVKQRRAHVGPAQQIAPSTAPAVPAGPRGPITVTCRPGGGGVIGASGPAGPQGPVGVNCPASSTG